MTRVVEKVTAFVTRQAGGGRELLLLQHPHAGIQIPAGTVEVHETPEEAVMREAAEETGLDSLVLCRSLGTDERELGEGQRMVARGTNVYSRSDASSFDWAYLKAGLPVHVLRQSRGFTQVNFVELDRVPNPRYVTMAIRGWVPDVTLASSVRRHFFHLEYAGPPAERWTATTDYHTFSLFWAPLDDLPEIIPPQVRWLDDFWIDPEREAG